ncbi:MAG: tRNA pseudouridine(38-40) synthase TruA [Polyangiales bacterium]
MPGFGTDERAPYGVALEIEYDGADFSGWQQQHGLRTVQGELTQAVQTMSGSDDVVRGASRTDAGVHALGQVVAFDAMRPISLDGWVRGLNTRLPRDIAVRRAWFVDAGYQPRFDSEEKTYRYVFDLGAVRSPLLRHRAWFVGRARCHPKLRRHPHDIAANLVDMEAIHAACRVLEGTHDFRSFQSANDPRENTVRTLHAIGIETPFAGESRLMAMTVRGNSFLQHMVRILAGTLLEVGRGRMTPSHVRDLLETHLDRTVAGETAPPHGLYLVKIRQRSRAQADLAPPPA